jgi:hypothetical protein
MRYVTDEFATDIAINGQGVRDDEEIGPKVASERRILVLGDSLVLSVQVDLQQTFCKRLERRLTSAYPDHKWRVINAGVQGYGPVEEWQFYRDIGKALQPDLVVVVAFVGNDAIEAYDQEGLLDRRHTQTKTGRTANIVRRWTRASTMVQLVRLRLDQLKAHFASAGIERPLMTYMAVEPAEVEHGLEVTRRAYGLIARDAAQERARTMLVLMPARFQVDDRNFRELSTAVEKAGGHMLRNAGTDRFWHALLPLHLPMLDLLPTLAAQPNREDLFFQRNVHLTPRGHAVVADALFQFLLSQDLRPVSQGTRPSESIQ